MITRAVLILLLLYCYCGEVFPQKVISRDADGDIWLMTDTLNKQMIYIGQKGNSIEVTTEDFLKSDRNILDSLIMYNQYDLWFQTKGYESFEPYASVVYSILFSKRMKIVEVRILKREAYNRNPIIDHIVIESIRKTGHKIWSKKKLSKKKKKKIIFVSRTKVVIPDELEIEKPKKITEIDPEIKGAGF